MSTPKLIPTPGMLVNLYGEQSYKVLRVTKFLVYLAPPGPLNMDQVIVQKLDEFHGAGWAESLGGQPVAGERGTSESQARRG